MVRFQFKLGWFSQWQVLDNVGRGFQIILPYGQSRVGRGFQIILPYGLSRVGRDKLVGTGNWHKFVTLKSLTKCGKRSNTYEELDYRHCSLSGRQEMVGWSGDLKVSKFLHNKAGGLEKIFWKVNKMITFWELYDSSNKTLQGHSSFFSVSWVILRF